MPALTDAERSKALYQERREKGLCVRCETRLSKEDRAAGRARCEACRATKVAIKMKAWRARQAAGLCPTCPADDRRHVAKGLGLCRRCADRNAEVSSASHRRARERRRRSPPSP